MDIGQRAIYYKWCSVSPWLLGGMLFVLHALKWFHYFQKTSCCPDGWKTILSLNSHSHTLACYFCSIYSLVHNCSILFNMDLRDSGQKIRNGFFFFFSIWKYRGLPSNYGESKSTKNCQNGKVTHQLRGRYDSTLVFKAI